MKSLVTIEETVRYVVEFEGHPDVLKHQPPELLLRHGAVVGKSPAMLTVTGTIEKVEG